MNPHHATARASQPDASQSDPTNPAPELVESAYWYETNDAPLLHHALTLADLAFLLHLDEQGIIPHDAARTLTRLLLELDQLESFSYDPAHGDAFTNRERWLQTQAPEAVGYSSTGRARREATTVAFRIVVRRGLLDLSRALIELEQTLLDVAGRHVEAAMPDYTYLQQGQPTTLAHYLLSFIYPFKRDFVRLRDAFEIVNQSPGGIGSINGSRVPIRRERLAELLGFSGTITHTRDAMWQVDAPVQAVTAAATLLIHLDRLAEDLQIFNSTEFGFITLDDAFARASVIMPQKKNPYPLAFVRGAAGSLIGRVTEMYAIARTPSAQVDNRILAHGAVPRALDLTTRCVRLMHGVCGTLTFNPDKMEVWLHDGFTQATDLADVLAQECELDYRTAHQIVGRMARRAMEENRSLKEVAPEMLDRVAIETIGRPLSLAPVVITAALDPHAAIEARAGTGGAAPARVQEMMQECRSDAMAQLLWVEGTTARIEQAETNLFEQVRSL